MEGEEGLGPIAHFGEPDFFLCWPLCGEADFSRHAFDSTTMIQKQSTAIQKPGSADSATIRLINGLISKRNQQRDESRFKLTVRVHAACR